MTKMEFRESEEISSSFYCSKHDGFIRRYSGNYIELGSEYFCEKCVFELLANNKIVPLQRKWED